MSYLSDDEFDSILNAVNVYSISSDEMKDISQYSFDAGKAKEYESFLYDQANRLEELCISKTFIVLHKDTKELVGYFTLSADTVKLTTEEKEQDDLTEVPFMSLPAIKVGKLASNKALSDKARRKGYGSFMLDLASTYAFGVLEAGVACRFLTVDADVEYYPDTVDFYIKNGFQVNQSRKRKPSDKTVSMRRDIFAE